MKRRVWKGRASVEAKGDPSAVANIKFLAHLVFDSHSSHAGGLISTSQTSPDRLNLCFLIPKPGWGLPPLHSPATGVYIRLLGIASASGEPIAVYADSVVQSIVRGQAANFVGLSSGETEWVPCSAPKPSDLPPQVCLTLEALGLPPAELDIKRDRYTLCFVVGCD